MIKSVIFWKNIHLQLALLCLRTFWGRHRYVRRPRVTGMFALSTPHGIWCMAPSPLCSHSQFEQIFIHFPLHRSSVTAIFTLSVHSRILTADHSDITVNATSRQMEWIMAGRQKIEKPSKTGENGPVVCAEGEYNLFLENTNTDWW